MRTYYILIICGIVVVLGLLFFPTVNTVVGAVDTTGFLPLLAAGTTILPYAFLGLVLYCIIKTNKK
jgi:hypothetical protein